MIELGPQADDTLVLSGAWQPVAACARGTALLAPAPPVAEAGLLRCRACHTSASTCLISGGYEFVITANPATVFDDEDLAIVGGTGQ